MEYVIFRYRRSRYGLVVGLFSKFIRDIDRVIVGYVLFLVTLSGFRVSIWRFFVKVCFFRMGVLVVILFFRVSLVFSGILRSRDRF